MSNLVFEPLAASDRVQILIVTTHPIQYAVPWFRELSVRLDVDLSVVFLRQLDAEHQGTGFGRSFKWDLPMLEGYRSKTLGIDPGSLAFRDLRKLIGVIKEIRPAMIVVTGWNEKLLLVAPLLCRLLCHPVVVRGDSNALKQRSTLARVFHRLMLRIPSGFLSVGRANRDFYVRSGVAGERIFDGCHFVENDRFLTMASLHASRREAMRSEYGIGAKDVTLVFCGKHVPFKRPWLLIDAARILRGRGWAVTVLFAGSGDLTDDLNRRAASANVPSYFTGFLNQTELWRAYVPADIFVLASDTGETWGLVTNEAMLFGLPVAVSDEVGCGPDLVEEGTTGVRFRADPAALADALEPLVADPALRGRMGAAGRDLVQTRYTSARATDGLIGAVRALCK